MVSNNGILLGDNTPVPYNNHMLSYLRFALFRWVCKITAGLPAGCPVTLGGGFLRDTLLGAEPKDLDFWIPANSNMSLINTSDMRTVFQTNMVSTSPYSDINNSAVYEYDRENEVQVNIMKSLIPFVNCEQWFEDLMRSFDTEISMIFMGLELNTNLSDRWETSIFGLDRIVVPHSLLEAWTLTSDYETTRYGYNAARKLTTSGNRWRDRQEKLRRKYSSIRSEDFEMNDQDFEPVVLRYTSINEHRLIHPEV